MRPNGWRTRMPITSKTALARVVLACALKHHTRRGGREPERWQRASQLVTHGLLRDAGFALPPEAEAWDGISAEQAYDRLPKPSDDGEDQSDACPSGNADDSGGAVGPPSRRRQRRSERPVRSNR